MKSGYSGLFMALIGCWLVAGCSHYSAQPDSSAIPVAPAKPLPAEAPNAAPSLTSTTPEEATDAVKNRAFTRDTLYSLLAAEIAGSRQQYDITLNNYAQQALITRDPQVAERATLIARYMNASQLAGETALLWVELSPESDEALANASMALMQAGRAPEAFEMSRRLQEKDKETLFQSIAANATELSAADRENLLGLYLEQLKQYPQDEQLLIGSGLLLQMGGNFEGALKQAEKARKLTPDSVPASLLEATLLHQLKRDNDALARLTNILESNPDSIRLRVQYARILAHNDLEAAQEQFRILSQQSPQDGDFRLSLALVALERRDLDTAIDAFEQLLDNNQHLSTAHYYLAQIAETRQDDMQALQHYLQVERGKDFIPATASLINIMIRQGDLISAAEHIDRLLADTPNEADNLQLLHARALINHNQLATASRILDRALTQSPNNTHLLFARAMLFDQTGQATLAEQNLRRVIAIDPQHASALNALGYMLTDRAERLDEAREMIFRAYALRPEDPAIIDSLGWLHFRTGNYSEALIYLRRAFNLYPDDEIAAHLGEVLWVINEQEQAQKVWLQGLETSPNSDIIRNTMERLQVPAP